MEDGRWSLVTKSQFRVKDGGGRAAATSVASAGATIVGGYTMGRQAEASAGATAVPRGEGVVTTLLNPKS